MFIEGVIKMTSDLPGGFGGRAGQEAIRRGNDWITHAYGTGGMASSLVGKLLTWCFYSMVGHQSRLETRSTRSSGTMSESYPPSRPCRAQSLIRIVSLPRLTSK